DLIGVTNARLSVLKSLKSLVTWSDMIDSIMLYTVRTDGKVWLEAGSLYDYKERVEIKRNISGFIDDNGTNALEHYMICQGENKNYMLRILKVEGSYLVINVSTNEILDKIKAAAPDADAIAFAIDEKGEMIASSKDLSGLNISVENEGKYIKVFGDRYLQTGCVSDTTGYYFGILTPQRFILQDVQIFSIFYWIMCFIVLVMIPLLTGLVRRHIEQPVVQLSDTMNQIAENGLDVVVDKKYRITELSTLVNSFNHMINRIKQLKIEKYEAQLESQKATMQYLQLQIKPHFYANMLNIVYSLAERRDFETIQKISKAIVNYSRYMFQDASELVELDRELNHVNDYMEIQKIRYMMQIECRVNVAEELKTTLIPPFIIQSFVENSVKYAFSTKCNSRIDIDITRDIDKDALIIVIRDNGMGYSDSLLSRQWEDINDNGHIGLNNVYRRLKLIYEDRASLELCNDNGAVTTITLPYISIDLIDLDEEA
ncbi:MAG: histidine kinase, partial [Pseudobutyrivibrio sp.]|nr:histidine kinase [Pseudobutyrivibrio sp.]